jgi:hypothetical protein
MKRVAVPLILAMLGACARVEEASVNPGDTNESESVVERVRASDDEQEPALGEWRNALQDEVAALEFGPVGTAPLLSLVCAERGGLVLQRHGAVATGAAPMMNVSIAGQGRQLPVAGVAGTTPMVRAAIPAGDALLGQLAGASAPITLRFGDGTPLILPTSPLIGQFVQSCAAGPEAAAAARAGGAATANAAVETPANSSNGAAPVR